MILYSLHFLGKSVQKTTVKNNGRRPSRLPPRAWRERSEKLIDIRFCALFSKALSDMETFTALPLGLAASRDRRERIPCSQQIPWDKNIRHILMYLYKKTIPIQYRYGCTIRHPYTYLS